MKPLLNNAETIKWYDSHSKEYAEKIGNKSQLDEIEQFSKHLPSGAKVLDLGCAAGRDSHIFAEKAFDVIGIDFSQKLIDIAIKSFPSIKFVRANMLDLPFEDGIFDGVWASACLVHLDDKEQVKNALLEIDRVLTTGGFLYVSMQNRDNVESGWVTDEHSKEGRFF